MINWRIIARPPSNVLAFWARSAVYTPYSCDQRPYHGESLRMDALDRIDRKIIAELRENARLPTL
jgi:hypothetical protein